MFLALPVVSCSIWFLCMSAVLQQPMAGQHSAPMGHRVYLVDVAHLEALQGSAFLHVAHGRTLCWLALYSIYLSFYLKCSCMLIARENGQKEKLKLKSNGVNLTSLCSLSARQLQPKWHRAPNTPCSIPGYEGSPDLKFTCTQALQTASFTHGQIH